jgi:hypothetical protein
MAFEKQKNQSSSTQLKSVLLGAVAVISTIISVVLSQPHFAVAGMDGKTPRLTAENGSVKDGFFSRAAFAETRINNTGKQLFWNTLTKSWLSDEQINLLLTAYAVGMKDGGREHAEQVQAILLQETIAGQLGRIGHMTAPVGKRSYGVMQVKISAARDMLRKYPEFGRFRSDEELIVALMTDDEFNIRIASKFMKYLKQNTRSVDAALVAYNIGLRASRKISRPQSFKYVVRTRRNLTKVVQNFNNQIIDPVVQVASR